MTRLWLGVLFAFAASAAAELHAQSFKPTRPIEFVAHTGPGGGNDVLARRIAALVDQDKLLPVRMQVVNKPGGNAGVAMAYLAEKKGEAHTLAVFGNVWLVNPLVSAEARVTVKDLTPIARLAIEPAMVVVRRPTLKEAGFDVPNVPVVRGILGPPGMSREAVAYWEDFFARLAQTPGWKKYLEENMFEDGFQKGGEFGRFLDEFAERMRPILTDAGLKVVR